MLDAIVIRLCFTVCNYGTESSGHRWVNVQYKVQTYAVSQRDKKFVSNINKRGRGQGFYSEGVMQLGLGRGSLGS